MLGSFARRASLPQTSVDLAARLSWGNPVEIAAVEARLMGTAPVCFNAAKWMAVDEHGRGFIVHVERVGRRPVDYSIALHVFDASNPTLRPTVYHIAPPQRLGALGAPCIAISSTRFATRVTIAFLAQPFGARAYTRLFIAAGTLSVLSSTRFALPTFRVYPVFEHTHAYVDLSNPSLFMDNEDHIHLVYAAQPIGASVIVYGRAEWNGDPNIWRWSRRELDEVGYDMRNPSVAARWQDGQLVVVVACKVARPGGYNVNIDASDVYYNVSTGRGRLQQWRQTHKV